MSRSATCLTTIPNALARLEQVVAMVMGSEAGVAWIAAAPLVVDLRRLLGSM